MVSDGYGYIIVIAMPKTGKQENKWNEKLLKLKFG
jgi:hypothetical protein